MKRRMWDSKAKAKIVLEGLSGKPVSELCNEYQIAQTQYYKWRDKFLSDAYRAFEGHEQSKDVARLKAKAQRLEQIIGQLSVELKKSEDML